MTLFRWLLRFSTPILLLLSSTTFGQDSIAEIEREIQKHQETLNHYQKFGQFPPGSEEARSVKKYEEKYETLACFPHCEFPKKNSADVMYFFRQLGRLEQQCGEKIREMQESGKAIPPIHIIGENHACPYCQKALANMAMTASTSNESVMGIENTTPQSINHLDFGQENISAIDLSRVFPLERAVEHGITSLVYVLKDESDSNLKSDFASRELLDSIITIFKTNSYLNEKRFLFVEIWKDTELHQKWLDILNHPGDLDSQQHSNAAHHLLRQQIKITDIFAAFKKVLNQINAELKDPALVNSLISKGYMSSPPPPNIVTTISSAITEIEGNLNKEKDNQSQTHFNKFSDTIVLAWRNLGMTLRTIEYYCEQIVGSSPLVTPKTTERLELSVGVAHAPGMETMIKKLFFDHFKSVDVVDVESFDLNKKYLPQRLTDKVSRKMLARAFELSVAQQANPDPTNESRGQKIKRWFKKRWPFKK